MYDEHFGLKETPFTIAPDPRFLYMSERHREALAHLVYGIEADGGFVLLTGEVGTGKTTISRCLLEQLPDNSNVAVILNPKMNSQELLATICDELHIQYPPGNTSLKTFVDLINRFLLQTNAQGRKTVVIVEEAQNLEMDVLEQLRLLTNLETNKRKLMQIIMIGQPELLQLLARPELRQLEQRITARYHLLPLSRQDTIDYVKHRLEVAGLKQPLFSDELLKKIYKFSGGIPRKINLLCDRALLGAYVQNQKFVDRKVLLRAATEIFGESFSTSYSEREWQLHAAIVVVTIALIIMGGYIIYHHKDKLTSFATKAKTPPEQPAVVDEKTSSISKDPELRLDVSPKLDSGKFFKVLDAQDTVTSKQDAYDNLLEQWGIPLASKSYNDPCNIAAAKGLNCMAHNGNLRSLQVLDRPAVLRFLSSDGLSVYGTLIGINKDIVTMMFEKQKIDVAIADLESRWFGDSTILWRTPPSFNGSIRVGSRGPDVQWLASRLATISGSEVTSNGLVKYDDKLIQQVKSFQRHEGLESDGIAGIQTLIRINSVTNNNVPKINGELIKPLSLEKQNAGNIERDDNHPPQDRLNKKDVVG